MIQYEETTNGKRFRLDLCERLWYEPFDPDSNISLGRRLLKTRRGGYILQTDDLYGYTSLAKFCAKGEQGTFREVTRKDGIKLTIQYANINTPIILLEFPEVAALPDEV